MKVMLVDDHPLFLEGLEYLLGTHGIKVAGAAKNGCEALIKARILKPDIILMDVRMPECDGVNALRMIKEEMPEIRVIMLSTSNEDEDLFKAIKYGASGYLLKDINAKELINMLADLEKGEPPLSPGLASRLLRELRRTSTDGHKSSLYTLDGQKRENLTERQLEILELVAKGKTYKEAANSLGLTERTVKYHMIRIMELLQLENKAQVISYAASMGLVDGK